MPGTCDSINCNPPVWKTTPSWGDISIAIADPNQITLTWPGDVTIGPNSSCSCTAYEFRFYFKDENGAAIALPYISATTVNGDAQVTIDQSAAFPHADGLTYTMLIDILMPTDDLTPDGLVSDPATDPVYNLNHAILPSPCQLHCQDTNNDPNPSWTNPQTWDIYLSTATSYTLSMDNFNALPTGCPLTFSLQNSHSYFDSIDSSTGDLTIDATSAKINPDLPNTYSTEIIYCTTDTLGNPVCSNPYKLELNFISTCNDFILNNNPSPSWSAIETWMIGETSQIVKAFDGWSTTPDSGCPIQFSLSVEKPAGTPVSSTYFAVDSQTGQFTLDGTSATIATDWNQSYDLKLNAAIDDGQGNLISCSTPFQFKGFFDSECYSAPDGSNSKAVINTSSASINDVTVAVLGNAVTQTASFTTDVESAKGAGYCGPKRIVLVSPSPAPSWLTVGQPALAQNNFRVQSIDVADATGTYTVILKQVLKDFEGISDQLAIQPDLSFTVTLTGCEVTSIQLDTVNSDSVYTAGTPIIVTTDVTGQTFPFPKYTLTPACLYTTGAMYAKVEGTQFDSSAYTTTVQEGGTAPDSLTWNAFTDDRVTHRGQTYTLEFFVTLDASCVGTACADQSIGTVQITWQDICATTVIQLPSTLAGDLPNLLTTSELAPAQIHTVNSWFTNTVAAAQGDIAYCGDYTLTVGSACSAIISAIDSNKPTSFGVQIQSSSTTDATTFPMATPTACTIGATLVDYAAVAAVTHSFTVGVDECLASVVWDYSGTPTFDQDKLYTIGPDPALVWPYPTYTMTPACNYPIHYKFKVNGGAGTLDTFAGSTTYLMISTTNSAPAQITVQTTDHLLVGTYAITLTTAFEDSIYSNQWTLGTQTWNLQINSVCQTTTFIDPLYADVIAGQQTTKNIDITIKDQESITYGNNDGITFCTPRVYTIGFKDSSGAPTAQPSFFNLVAGTSTLQFSPTASDPVDFWTVEVSACLQDLPATCSNIYSFKATIGPCEVTSVAWSGSVSDITHYVWQTGSQTYNFPTLTQTPACNYIQQIQLVQTNGDPLPPWVTISLDQLTQYKISSSDLAHIGTYTFQVGMFLTNYPNVGYTPDYRTTPAVFATTFTVTIVNPCEISVLDTMHTYKAMATINVLRPEGAEIQYFNEPQDSMSLAWDEKHDPPLTSITWYELTNPGTVGTSAAIALDPPVYNPVAPGSLLCGPRTYTVTGGSGAVLCSSFVKVTETVAHQPRIEVYPTDNSEVGTWNCAIETTLTNFAMVPMVSETFQVKVGYCVLTNFFTSNTINTIQEYKLGDTMYALSFPTYTQVPACNYPIIHTCLSQITDALTTIYPVGSYANADPVSAPVTNIQTIENCNTVSNQYEVFLNTNTLEGKQYQGDYQITLTAQTNDANSQFLTDSTYTFIMRVINPCKWTTYQSVYNKLTPPTIPQLNARVLQTPNQLSSFVNFVDTASSTYGNQATPDGYTLCGTRTYSLSPAYAFLTITKISETSVQVAAHPTLVSEIGYTGYSQPCWSVSVIAKFDNPNYQTISGSGLLKVCIEECMVEGFTPDITATTSLTYNIWHQGAAGKFIQFPHYTQVPACGYSLQMSATIEKFATPLNAVSDPDFVAEPLTDTSHYQLRTLYDAVTDYSYIRLFGSGLGPDTATYPDGYLHLLSNRPADNGQYEVIVKIDILGQKTTYLNWAYDFSTVSPQYITYTITYVDPCETALLNDAGSAYRRVPINLQTSVAGDTVTQNIYEFPDSVSEQYGPVYANPLTSLAGVKICGPRKYIFSPTVAATSWLSFTQASNGLISVTATSNSEQNYAVTEPDLTINPNQYPGHRVEITSYLQYYSWVQTKIDFYVVITECIIQDFSYDGEMQSSFLYNLYSGVKLVPIVKYNQIPACGYPVSMTLIDKATLIRPTWIQEDTATNSWKVLSTDMNHANVYSMTQQAQISFTYMGSPPPPTYAKTTFGPDTTDPIIDPVTLAVTGYVSKQHYSMNFTITIVDPCLTTVIDTYDASATSKGDYFDITKFNTNVPIIKTSVLYGSDITSPATGIPQTYDFPIHWDTKSTLYKNNIDFATIGRYHACDERKYTFYWYNPDPLVMAYVDISTISNFFLKVNPLGTDQKQLSVYTQSETDRSWINPDWDTTTHQFQLKVELLKYPTITPVYEYFRVEIQSCIVKEIKRNSMGASSQAKLDGYTEANPWEFYLFYIPTQSVTINSFTLVPNCEYAQSNKLEVLPDSQPSISLWPGMIASQAPSVVPTIVTFYSEDQTLDVAAYDYIDPITLTEDKTESTTKNPYHINVVNYLPVGTYNINSYVHLWSLDSSLLDDEVQLRVYDKDPWGAKNTEVNFWVWPRDPCRKCSLIPDDYIYNNETFIYFIDDQPKTEPFNPTVTSIMQDSQYGNKDVCGNIVYEVVTISTDDYNVLSVVYGDVSPEISTYSNDRSMADHQLMRVKSSLPYPLNFITAYAAWSVDAYIIESPIEFEDQYYQISGKEGGNTLIEFKMKPENPNFEFAYSISVLRHKDWKVLDEKESEWIVFTDGILQVGWYTTSGETEGNYTISLIGVVTDTTTQITYAVYGNNSFKLTVSKEPPPIEIVIYPSLVTPLQDQSVMFGKSLTYKISEGISDAGYEVTVTAEVTQKWLTFTESSSQFKIAEGATTEDDIGGYAVKVILKDEIGTVLYLSFMIYIEDDPSRYIVKDDLSALAPVPTIELSQKGLMTINWDKRIKVPRNLTETRSQKSVYYDEQIQDIVYKDALEITLVPGKEEPEFQKNFTWDYVSWKNQQIEIQIYFETPLKVGYESSEKDRAELRVIFYDTYLFVSKSTGAQIFNYTTPNKGSYNLTVGPQIPVLDPPEPAVELAVLGDIGQVVLQLTISYFLNNLWSVIQTQQIIVLMPLFANIFIPDAAKDFFAFMMEVAAFDIVPTDEPFAIIFGTEPPDPISETIDEGGFGTTLFFFNLGSLAFAVVSGPFVFVLARIFKRSGVKSIIKKGVSWERGLFWGSQILILDGSYVILGICTTISVVTLEWEGYGYAINNLFGIFYFCLCIIFPFFQLYFINKWFHLLETPETKKKWGAMYEGMNLKDNTFVYYKFWFYFRRLTLGMVLIIFPSHLFIHMNTLVFQTIVAVIIMGSTKPMEFNQANKMEFFNEIMILFIMYAMMLITNWNYDEELRDFGGNMMMYFVLTHVAVNLSLMVFNNLDDWRNQWRRYRLLRKNAKSRGMRNRKLQKKKRHAKWKKLGKEIKQRQARIKEQSVNSHADSYDLRQLSGEVSEIISSAGLSEFSNIDHKGNIFRQPAEAPNIRLALNSQELGLDHGAKQNLAQNQQLAQTKIQEYTPGQEDKVHNGIARQIDEDVILGDHQNLFKQGLPQDWNKAGAGLFRMAKMENSFYGNKDLQVNNKISRAAQQDAILGRGNRVGHLTQNQGHKVQANTKAIHNKLFQHQDVNDTSINFYKPKNKYRQLLSDKFKTDLNIMRKTDTNLQGNNSRNESSNIKRQLTANNERKNRTNGFNKDSNETLDLRPVQGLKPGDIFVPKVKPEKDGEQVQKPPLLQRPKEPAPMIDDFADFDFGDIDANEQV